MNHSNEKEIEIQEKVIDPVIEERKRQEAQALITAVQSGLTNTLRQKVAKILNKYPEARKSDITLQIKFWEEFHGHTSQQVDLKKMYEYERLSSLVRARAKIQNEYKLFLSDERTRKIRREREEIEKEAALLDKPTVPIMHLYADETGKDSEYIIIGSVWALDDRHNGLLNHELIEWTKKAKEENIRFPDEFHFKNLNNKNRDELRLYKDFFKVLLDNSAMVSFRAIAVNKSKLSTPIDEIINDLFYRLTIKGMEHEILTGRVVLPRQINYFKDRDDNDNTYNISKFSELLSSKFKEQYGDDLVLNSYVPLDSKLSRLIQAADLFTGSLNRLYNVRPKGGNINNKDELADYIIDRVGLQEIRYSIENLLNDVEDGLNTDMATIHVYD
ncbi:DUF3800 domain-containing protein [Bacillus altitudinis]|uniref:DUF3800 domain-containing protein n=1 Tax=Bacillus altitudinis TaxID=293387 RepID=UPI0022817A29|nr:DUF3800 domain-containing protein [Bacillus altitudinis]MCY7694919.1 DUF3800 domain-containing protein [Bacillus altitudinis]